MRGYRPLWSPRCPGHIPYFHFPAASVGAASLAAAAAAAAAAVAEAATPAFELSGPPPAAAAPASVSAARCLLLRPVEGVNVAPG